MNILLTSVGRRSYLVEYFRTALSGAGEVIASNMFSDTPGMYAADKGITVPPSDHPSYFVAISRICEENSVSLVCSLHDLDTYSLSKHRDALDSMGVSSTLPDEAWAFRCLDKSASGEILAENGFAVPRTFTCLSKATAAIRSGELCFPVIIKSRYGFGSLGLHKCNNFTELRHYYHAANKQTSAPPPLHSQAVANEVLIQEFISGREYCIDIVNDLNGRYAAHFACEVHSMRAGETDAVTTTSPEPFNDLAHRLSALTRHRGVWGIDVILEGNGTAYIIDMNPRFTGDYPFHQIAGVNVPAALVAWANGDQPDPVWLTPKVGVRGYKDLVPRVAK